MPQPWPASTPPDFSNIFTGTFRVFFRHPGPFVLSYAILGVVFAVGYVFAIFATLGPMLSGGFDPATMPPQEIASRFGRFLLVLPLFAIVVFVASTYVQGAVSHYAVLRHRGAQIKFAFSLRRAVKLLVSLVGSTLLALGIIAGLFMLAFVPFFFGLLVGSFALFSLGLIFIVIVMTPVAIYVYIGFSLAVPAIMMEDAHAVSSLRRSWTLARGHRWSIFGVLLVVGLLSGGVSVGLGVALLSVDPLVSTITQLAATIVLSSWSVIALAVAYDLIARPSRLGAAWWMNAPPSAAANLAAAGSETIESGPR